VIRFAPLKVAFSIRKQKIVVAESGHHSADGQHQLAESEHHSTDDPHHPAKSAHHIADDPHHSAESDHDSADDLHQSAKSGHHIANVAHHTANHIGKVVRYFPSMFFDGALITEEYPQDFYYLRNFCRAGPTKTGVYVKRESRRLSFTLRENHFGAGRIFNGITCIGAPVFLFAVACLLRFLSTVIVKILKLF